jgi:hypothetical protein
MSVPVRAALLRRIVADAESREPSDEDVLTFLDWADPDAASLMREAMFKSTRHSSEEETL